jgi:hypothetical protein
MERSRKGVWFITGTSTGLGRAGVEEVEGGQPCCDCVEERYVKR